MPITDTSVFQTCSGGPFHCSRKWVTNNNQMFIIASFYILPVYASIVLLLPSCYWTSHQNEAEYIKIVHSTDYKFFFVFRKFPMGLKQNLREEDNLSTKGPSPMCPLFGGFTELNDGKERHCDPARIRTWVIWIPPRCCYKLSHWSSCI